MSRMKIAAGNWKMNTNLEEASQLANIIAAYQRPDDVVTILGVPAVFLAEAQKSSKNYSNIYIAAQNCHQKESGAYTGEISAAMLASMEVPYVILGHSERRAYCNEDDALILEKCLMALKHNVKPIYCCGEPLEIRDSNNHIKHVSQQLEDSILNLSLEQILQIIIAYEPVWAIGTGRTATPEQAQEMHQEIRKKLKERYGEDVADRIPILYGGSVKPKNAEAIFSQKDVDGGLVGGASLKADSFLKIIDSF